MSLVFKRRLKVGPNKYLTVECTDFVLKELFIIFPNININKIESWNFGLRISERTPLDNEIEYLNPNIEYSNEYLGIYYYDSINKILVFIPVLRFPKFKKYFDIVFSNAILNEVIINEKK